MSWDRIVNQDRAKRLLARSLASRRLAQAYLFSGPEGIGKYALALELAKTLNCERSGDSACDTCPSCVKAIALQHPDIHLVFALPVGRNEKQGDAPLDKLTEDDMAAVLEELARKAQNPYHRLSIPRATTIKVNSIRALRRESSLSVFGGGRKVFVVIDADMMNDESSNALLKTLEEPNPDITIILTSSRPERLLPTIVSRCQQIRLDPLSEETLSQALVERGGVGTERAAEAARMASGSFARAMQYASEEPHERRDDALELLRTLLVRPRVSLVQEIDRLAAELDRSSLADLLMLMQRWLRDAMRLREGLGGSLSARDLESLGKFTDHYPAMEFIATLAEIDRAISLLEKNAYIPLVLLDLAVRMKTLAHGG